MMLMQWGQYIDHDLTEVHMFEKEKDKCDKCENYDSNTCFPISIPHTDTFFNKPGAPRCFPFRRSKGQRVGGGPKEQSNALTSHLDASMVYGSDACSLEKVRNPFRRHLLRMSSRMMPLEHGVPECRGHGGLCYLGGDARVNEQPGLTSIHHVFLRLHNNLAQRLLDLNPSWGDERVFQETRRLIGAIIQHVTYSEFLPRVLGREVIAEFELDLQERGYSGDYDPACSTAVFNEFSTAAFRFGHSMVQPHMVLMREEEMVDMMQGRAQGKMREMPLRKHFHNPDFIRENPGAVEELLRGLMTMPMGEVDTHFTREITNHLFEKKTKFSGLDLVALNIQRGRDHGLPGYNVYREVCGLQTLKSFTSTFTDIPGDSLARLSSVFTHPDDIDLFTGLMTEARLPGALVGPTLACLLAAQFSNLKKCDRFWYETSDSQLRFSPQQLEVIRGVTMSSLMCQGGQDMHRMPRHGFDLHDHARNPLMECGQPPMTLDLIPWEDQPHFPGAGFCPKEPASVFPCFNCNCTTAGDVCEASCASLITWFGANTVKRDNQCNCDIKF